MQRWRFTVLMDGVGNTSEEAWDNAVEAFQADPGDCDNFEVVKEEEVQAMSEFQPRYVAYAKAHGQEPEAMMELDRVRWPGGVMCGFILWISKMKRTFQSLHPESFLDPHKIGDDEAWTTFLKDTAQAHSAALDHAESGRAKVLHCHDWTADEAAVYSEAFDTARVPDPIAYRCTDCGHEMTREQWESHCFEEGQHMKDLMIGVDEDSKCPECDDGTMEEL